jgi:hypothetical protein
MESIIQPTDNFDFSSISLAQPVTIQNGAYFTKILMNGKPLYIETPKSLTRQGFIKTGKKIHCDLMFSNIDEIFIRWIENLENKCQELIFDKSDTWFENEMDLNDIKGAFASMMRIYKAGKYYLVKVNVRINNATSIPIIKIYDETENMLTIDDVNDKSDIISIIEISGIRFTNKNFQIELELKQIMILKEELLFENCLIKNKNIKTSLVFKNVDNLENKIDVKNKNKNNLGIDEPVLALAIDIREQDIIEKDILEDVLEEEEEEEEKEKDEYIIEKHNLGEINKNLENLSNMIIDDQSIGLPLIELDIEELLDDNILAEVNVNQDTLEKTESLILKKPTQVYYEIYKTARKRAKDAKKQSILAFLEAKNIKNLYMLDIDSEDSEDSE